MEVPVEEIKKLGQWESNCYELYIWQYSREEKAQTEVLIRNANEKKGGLEALTRGSRDWVSNRTPLFRRERVPGNLGGIDLALRLYPSPPARVCGDRQTRPSHPTSPGRGKTDRAGEKEPGRGRVSNPTQTPGSLGDWPAQSLGVPRPAGRRAKPS
ncbi:hypothetical protein PCANC_12077 [Puccinia coronata f. sp. avenae]|uniref:Uncharacterized protein n=1 Tax=Puccinia coronata f. sp. avenae TaxID=200324 RepID=A0A2N5T3M4_9BASI|nr:hypothetical protein PCANC_12077 [Puccinia coronata f. sp. avenae]